MRVGFSSVLVFSLYNVAAMAQGDTPQNALRVDVKATQKGTAAESENTVQDPGPLSRSVAPSSGCAVGSLLPGGVMGVGCLGMALAVEMIIGSENSCAAIGGVLVGVMFGVLPMLVGISALGVMAPCGAMVGNAVGAGLQGRCWVAGLIQAAPGLAVGVLGSGLMLGSVVAAEDIQRQLGADVTTPLVLTGVIVGSLLALAAGPVAIASAVLLGGAAEEHAGTQPVAAPAAKDQQKISATDNVPPSAKKASPNAPVHEAAPALAPPSAAPATVPDAPAASTEAYVY